MSDHILEAAQPTIGNIPPQAWPDTGTGIMPNRMTLYENHFPLPTRTYL